MSTMRAGDGCGMRDDVGLLAKFVGTLALIGGFIEVVEILGEWMPIKDALRYTALGFVSVFLVLPLLAFVIILCAALYGDKRDRDRARSETGYRALKKGASMTSVAEEKHFAESLSDAQRKWLSIALRKWLSDAPLVGRFTPGPEGAAACAALAQKGLLRHDNGLPRSYRITDLGVAVHWYLKDDHG